MCNQVQWKQISHSENLTISLVCSVPDPFHYDVDQDPLILIRNSGSGSGSWIRLSDKVDPDPDPWIRLSIKVDPDPDPWIRL